MNSRIILTICLLGFMAFALVFLFLQDDGKSTKTEELQKTAGAADTTGASDTGDAVVEGSGAAAAEPGEKLAMYYFHTTFRCATCNKIEELADRTIRFSFSEELGDGAASWQVVDVDEPANKHYKEDFELHSASVVMVEMAGGEQVRWKNCEKVWELVNSPDRFSQYLVAEAREYLGDS